MPDMTTYKCPICGVVNRLPMDKLGSRAKCGKCGQWLPSIPTLPVPVDEGSFAQEVLQAGLPVLADFWAPWCGPCRALAPSLEVLAQELAGRLKVVKVNTDENRALAQKYQIMSIPTLILFEDGHVKNQIAGALPIQQLRNWIGRTMGWL